MRSERIVLHVTIYHLESMSMVGWPIYHQRN